MATPTNNQPSSPSIRVTDLNVVAFLYAKGHEILAIEPGVPPQRVFVFGASSQADIDAYHRNALIPARAFAASLRDLKAVLKGATR